MSPGKWLVYQVFKKAGNKIWMHPALPCMATPTELKVKLGSQNGTMNSMLALLLLQIFMIGSHVTSDLLASLSVATFNGEKF